MNSSCPAAICNAREAHGRPWAGPAIPARQGGPWPVARACTLWDHRSAARRWSACRLQLPAPPNDALPSERRCGGAGCKRFAASRHRGALGRAGRTVDKQPSSSRAEPLRRRRDQFSAAIGATRCGLDHGTSSHASSRPGRVGLRRQICRAPVVVSIVAVSAVRMTSRSPLTSHNSPA